MQIVGTFLILLFVPLWRKGVVSSNARHERKFKTYVLGAVLSATVGLCLIVGSIK